MSPSEKPPSSWATALLLATLAGCGHTAAPAVTPVPAVAPVPAAAGPTAPARCPGCKALFDGKTLDGWQMEKPGSFVVKEGAIASTGPGSHLWTADDRLDYRLFFTIRQVGA